MSKAIIIPMLLMRQGALLWAEQQQAMLPSPRLGLAFDRMLEALTGSDLGSADREEITTRLATLLAQLLRWEFQKGARTETSAAAIRMQRIRIAMAIVRRPGFGRLPGRLLREQYRAARTLAMAQSGLGRAAFPDDCPYSIAEVLDSGFLPNAA
jgi:ribosomal protein L29